MAQLEQTISTMTQVDTASGTDLHEISQSLGSGQFTTKSESNLQIANYVNTQTAKRIFVVSATTVGIEGAYYNGPNNDGIGATFTFTATGAATIGGVQVVLNNDYVVKNQGSGTGTPIHKGLWTCTTAGATNISTVLTRRDDFNNVANIFQGAEVSVLGGSQANSIWVMNSDGPINVGSSSISFSKLNVPPLGEIFQATSITTPVTSTTQNTIVTTQNTTLATASTQAFTFTNSAIRGNSLIQATLQDYSGALITNGIPILMVSDVITGSCQINITNAGANALNGTLTISVTIQ